MKVTVALAALAAAASATTELEGRQAGHNDKPCKKRPDVTSVGRQHVQTTKFASC